jgi:hypothetical protein
MTVHIFVKTPGDARTPAQTIPLDLDPGDTIQAVKQQIHDKHGVSVDRHCLRRKGMAMADNSSLSNCDIQDGAMFELELQVNTLSLRAGRASSVDVIPEDQADAMSFVFGDERLVVERPCQAQAQVIIGSTYGVHSTNGSTESMLHAGVLLGAADGRPLYTVAGRTFQYALMHRYCSKFILTCTNTEKEAKQSLNFGVYVDMLGDGHKSSATMQHVVKTFNERNGQPCKIETRAAKEMIQGGQFKQSQCSTNCLDTALALFKAIGGDTQSVLRQMKRALFGSATVQLQAVREQQTEVADEADRFADYVEAALQHFIGVHEGQGRTVDRFLGEAKQCMDHPCNGAGTTWGLTDLELDALVKDQQLLYRHTDGRIETVTFAKRHSGGEGGGCTIVMPSPHRERHTLGGDRLAHVQPGPAGPVRSADALMCTITATEDELGTAWCSPCPCHCRMYCLCLDCCFGLSEPSQEAVEWAASNWEGSARRLIHVLEQKAESAANAAERAAHGELLQALQVIQEADTLLVGSMRNVHAQIYAMQHHQRPRAGPRCARTTFGGGVHGLLEQHAQAAMSTCSQSKPPPWRRGGGGGGGGGGRNSWTHAMDTIQLVGSSAARQRANECRRNAVSTAEELVENSRPVAAPFQRESRESWSSFVGGWDHVDHTAGPT